jgi:hypothetical protein
MVIPVKMLAVGSDCKTCPITSECVPLDAWAVDSLKSPPVESTGGVVHDVSFRHPSVLSLILLASNSKSQLGHVGLVDTPGHFRGGLTLHVFAHVVAVTAPQAAVALAWLQSRHPPLHFVVSVSR